MAKSCLRCAVLLTLGFLSLGYQLLGSRLLAPYFGSSIIPWAFLISVFLAAFALGSILGGWLSPSPIRAMRWLTTGALLGFSVTAWTRRPLLAFLDTHCESLYLALTIATLSLFFLPVACLSAWSPIIVHSWTREGPSAGLASGCVYGLSTVGNIAGVMGTAFLLIPHFPVSQLLGAWCVLAVVTCLAAGKLCQ